MSPTIELIQINLTTDVTRSHNEGAQGYIKNEKVATDVDAQHDFFQTPHNKQTASSSQSSSHHIRGGPNHEFKSYLLDGKNEKFFMTDKRYNAPRKNNWIIYAFIIFAFGCSALLNWRIAVTVPKHDYCLVLDDSFSSLNKDVWKHEVQVDGFGTGSFDWTTTDSRNAFTDREGLHIVPTLTTETTDITEDQILDGFALNLTRTDEGDGSCTADQTSPAYNMECSIRSNITSRSIVNPVRSARLTTKGSKSILYGRVEVTAKLPQGDWLWPAIWMMPEDSVYGTWPLSGEIDIMESRGNDRSYAGQGRNSFMSTLHWGPSVQENSYLKTTRARTQKRHDFSEDFHTYGIEWTKDYLYTYIDNPLQHVLYVDFKKLTNMWTYGQFQGHAENGSFLANPWVKSENSNAPFDQKFYLILNVAVGSTRGWFKDAVGNKPWNDAGKGAAEDFYGSKSKWLPTWGKGNERGMTIKNVKMWQQGKCKS